jgi:hypothetical protein
LFWLAFHPLPSQSSQAVTIPLPLHLTHLGFGFRVLVSRLQLHLPRPSGWSAAAAMSLVSIMLDSPLALWLQPVGESSR